MKRYFTSESVTEGHPDKFCDLVSDTILNYCLENDQNSRVAIETSAKNYKIFVFGEITTKADVSDLTITDLIHKVAKKVYGEEYANNIVVEVEISKQSEDIALGTNDDVGGAGDQGMMIGFACNETEDYMPLPISLAHRLALQLAKVRKDGTIPCLKADGKTQVTVEYEDDKPVGVDTVVISTQHEDGIIQAGLQVEVLEKVILPIIPVEMRKEDMKVHINPTGSFVLGGPQADAGLTGRKIIVDTYGGYASHGGGAFSGKDPSKVDRSGAYMARFIAKNVVANGLADKCEIQLAYAIGVKEPVSIYVNTFETSKINEEEIVDIIKKNFDLTPKGIIETLDLLKPIYTATTNYGHFGEQGMNFMLPWEMVIDLQK